MSKIQEFELEMENERLRRIVESRSLEPWQLQTCTAALKQIAGAPAGCCADAWRSRAMAVRALVTIGAMAAPVAPRDREDIP